MKSQETTIKSNVKPKEIDFKLTDVKSFNMCKCKRVTLRLHNDITFSCMYSMLLAKRGISMVDVRKTKKKFPTTPSCNHCQTK